MHLQEKKHIEAEINAIKKTLSRIELRISIYQEKDRHNAAQR